MKAAFLNCTILHNFMIQAAKEALLIIYLYLQDYQSLQKDHKEMKVICCFQVRFPAKHLLEITMKFFQKHNLSRYLRVCHTNQHIYKCFLWQILREGSLLFSDKNTAIIF